MKRAVFITIPLLIAAILLSACNNSGKDQLAKNKELIKKFTELLNNKKFSELSSVMKSDFRRHSKATTDMPELSSLDDFIKLQKEFLSSFSDQKVTIKKIIAEGDLVAVYAIYSGINDGPLPPFPATNKYAELNFMGIFRIENDKIAEMWVEWDNISFLKQLGLFPPPDA